MFRPSVRPAGLVATAVAQRAMERRAERALSRMVDRIAMQAKNDIRQDMAASGLGRLSGTIGAGSDLRKRRVHRTARGFSVSGWVFVRGKSDRTLGAIKAYTEGADITPQRSRWLWIATPAIPSRVGRFKMTPARYDAAGLDGRIGPLVFVPGRSAAEALLVVKNVTVNRVSGGGARRRPRRGAIGSTREERDEIVAFVGIRRTSRARRTDPVEIMRRAVAAGPAILAQELRN